MSAMLEKEKYEASGAAQHNEIVDGAPIDSETGSTTKHDYNPTGIDEKKLMRKIDWKLIPWLCFLLLSFLDRSAIGNARLFGLQKELNLNSQQYNWCLTAFFFPYALAEVPSNILLKRLSPRVWFPLITVLVGICMTCQGVVHSYGGLLATRFCLGLVEAGLFPGVNYLMSGWYKRSEFGLRAAIFFSAATLSGAFGGLLSAALSKMDGIGGHSGWRWIFIIIGIVTTVAGLISPFLVQNFPDTATFLTEEERRVVIGRLQADQQFSAAGEKFRWKQVVKAAVDPKTWMGMLAYAGADGPLYAFSLFTPTIINQLGYSSIRANLVSVPIYAVACIATVAVGFMADRYPNRNMFSIIFFSVGAVGYIILIANDPKKLPGLSYAAIYLAAMGIYCQISNIVALTSGNAEGAYKRSVLSAVVISFGNINGAVSSNIYPTRTAPRYRMGHAIALGYIVMGIFASASYMWYCKVENRKRAAGLRDETLLMDESQAKNDTPEARAERVERAAGMRMQRVAELKQQGLTGRFKALLASVDELGGGVYADVDDARVHKGDAWSGFQYRP